MPRDETLPHLAPGSSHPVNCTKSPTRHNHLNSLIRHVDFMTATLVMRSSRLGGGRSSQNRALTDKAFSIRKLQWAWHPRATPSRLSRHIKQYRANGKNTEIKRERECAVNSTVPRHYEDVRQARLLEKNSSCRCIYLAQERFHF